MGARLHLVGHGATLAPALTRIGDAIVTFVRLKSQTDVQPPSRVAEADRVRERSSGSA
jgi:hypothetical protein